MNPWLDAELLRESGVEAPHDLTDFKSDPVDRCLNWLVSNKPVTENYVNGQICIHVHVRLTIGETQSRDFCAAFENAGEYFSGLYQYAGDDRDKCRLGRGGRDYKALVFVNVGEVIEPRKGVGIRRILSLVRLQRLNDCGISLPETGNSRPPLTDKLDFVAEDRKLRAAARLLFPCQFRKVPCEVIETVSQVVDDVANNHRDVDGVLVDRNFFGVEIIPTCLRVVLHRDRVGVKFCGQARDLRVQGLQMLFRPTDLGERTFHALTSS